LRLTGFQLRLRRAAVDLGKTLEGGIKFNLGALLASPSSLLQVPIYLFALLAVRLGPGLSARCRNVAGTTIRAKSRLLRGFHGKEMAASIVAY
jgi:hypothetical protein